MEEEAKQDNQPTATDYALGAVAMAIIALDKLAQTMCEAIADALERINTSLEKEPAGKHND